MTNQVAKNFTLDEFLVSETATRKSIPNEPKPAHLINIRNYLAPGMQRIRDLLNRVHSGGEVGVIITSGYRSPALNVAVGGSMRSQHSQGMAADFISPRFGTPREICLLLTQHKEQIRYDQLIFEGTWVHVSFSANPRGEALTAQFRPAGGVRYTVGIV